MENEEKQVNKTMVIVKYIFIFFTVISLIGGGFFAYLNYLKPSPEEIVVEKKEDNKFNDLFKDEDKKDRNDDINNNTEYVENNCHVDDQTVISGDKILLYSRRLVNPFENCLDYAKERVCDDGFILGDKSFKYSSCRADTDCQLPDNTIIKNNESIKFYSKKIVPFGESCERYAAKRTCKSTILTGDERFIYKNCKISYDSSCDVGGGKVLADNQTHVFYSKNGVDFGEKCVDFSRRLICSDAVLQGGDTNEFKYWSCSQKSADDCYIDGIKIEHGTSENLYSKKFGTSTRDCNFFKEIRTCTNGSLDGQSEYKYSKCYDN